jgi:hypothetical protein
MNHVIAYQLLASELNAFRELPSSELRQLIGEKSTRRVHGNDGVDYDLTVIVRWRLDVDGDIAITAFVGESSWGAPHDSLDDTIVVSNVAAKPNSD